MKEEIKNRWIEALKSGKYKQGNGFLKRDDKYCCLGVLCDLAVQDGIVVWEDQEEENPKRNWSRIASPGFTIKRNDYLIAPVVEWAGMEGSRGWLPENYNEHNTLDALNDSGLKFDEITEVIEKYWEKL